MLGKTFPRQAAYLASQAAEKGARALIDINKGFFGREHSFAQMANELGQGHPLHQQVMDLDEFTPASTGFRYPNNEEPPPIPTAKQLNRIFTKVGAFIKDVQDFVAPDPMLAQAAAPQNPALDPTGNPVLTALVLQAKRQTLKRVLEHIGHPQSR